MSAEYTSEQIIEAVRSRFTIRDFYLRQDGSVEFKVAKAPEVKQSFVKLVTEFKPHGYLPVLRSLDDALTLMVVRTPPVKRFKTRIPLILFLATIGTVAGDGFIRSASFPGYNTAVIVTLYTLGVLGIIGVHELGHKVVSARNGVGSSLPYFIPGIPGALPTFGAVITSAEPPINRDSLFDLGSSGPISGLIVTLLVALGGGLTTVAVPLDELSRQAGLQTVTKLDIFNDYLLNTLTKTPEGTGLVLSPLIFASSLGFLITFLNLMPAWQLDGGHIARSIFSGTKHKIATYASIVILFALGFQLMALLILVLSFRSPEMRPLDDVSPLSTRRKMSFIVIWALAAIIYVAAIMNNPFFFR